MTNKIKAYSATPGSNNAASPDGWPDGMAPSGLNNSDREFAARVREWYADPAWIDYGDTIVTSASTTVSISGDVTGEYIVGRAIRAGQSDSAVGYVTAAAYSAPNTSITCSGLNLTSVSQIELGAIKKGNSLPNNLEVNLGTATTAITQSAGDNSTKVATTAYVVSEVSASAARAGGAIGGAYTATSAYTTITESTPAFDDSVPLVTEGSELLSISYACGTTTAQVYVEAFAQGTSIGNFRQVAAIFAGSTCVGSAFIYANNSEALQIECDGFHSPASTSAVTYSFRLGNGEGGTLNVNGSHVSGRVLGGSSQAYLRVTEVKA